MPLVSLRSLKFTYPGSAAPALDSVSLDIEPGDYLAVVGANGSGKSTLARCINGLLTPPPGAVLVDGMDPSDGSRLRDVRRTVSLVFQSPPDQIVASVVEEDVAFGLENLGLPREEMRVRVGEALEALGLSAERTRPPRFLSAGQQQRLAIAGALVMRPRCIVFDEATAMLDPVGRSDVLDRIDELVAAGMAVVHVTHDMAEAARARRVAVLAAGRIVFDGTAEDLFGASALPGAGLPDAGLAMPPACVAARAFGLRPIPGESAADLAARIIGDSELTPMTSAVATPSGTPPVDAALAGNVAVADEAGPVFVVEAASFSFLKGTANERRAVDGVSLSVRPGEMLAVVGVTGSGKSTLLQLLDALLFSSKGSIRAFGMDTSDPKVDPRAVRMRAPLAMQRPETAIFEFYAGDEAAFGPRNQGLSGPALVARVRAAMDSVGIPYDLFRDRRARAMSGGEKRRLALASILSMDPEALLFDEPTSSLDAPTKAAVMGLLRSAAAGGRTVVFATHSMEEAAMADRVAVMSGGRLVACDTPASVFGSGWDDGWGLSRPFGAVLADELRGRGAAVPGGIVDLETLLAAFRRAPVVEALA